jgi:hypothetical protein
MAQLKFDVAGIQQESSQARALAGSLRSLRQEWMAATADAPSALGMSELVTAFESMRQAWAGQFEVCADVVSALGDRLAVAAASYSNAEKANTDQVRSVGR